MLKTLKTIAGRKYGLGAEPPEQKLPSCCKARESGNSHSQFHRHRWSSFGLQNYTRLSLSETPIPAFYIPFSNPRNCVICSRKSSFPIEQSSSPLAIWNLETYDSQVLRPFRQGDAPKGVCLYKASPHSLSNFFFYFGDRD